MRMSYCRAMPISRPEHFWRYCSAHCWAGVLVLRVHGIALVSAALLAVAAAGYGASRYIPVAKPTAPLLRINPNILAGNRAHSRL